jgi:hypothetical protein
MFVLAVDLDNRPAALSRRKALTVEFCKSPLHGWGQLNALDGADILKAHVTDRDRRMLGATKSAI